MWRLSAKMALAIALTGGAANPTPAHAVTFEQLQKIQGAQQRGVLAEARRAATEGRLSDAERLLDQARNMNDNPAEVKEVAGLIADARAAESRRAAEYEAERKRKDDEKRREEEQQRAAAAQGSSPAPATSYGGAPSAAPNRNTVTVKFNLAVGSVEYPTAVTLTRRDAYGSHRMAASPAMADKGMLRISTDPGRARLRVDGVRKGATPTEPGQSFIIQLPAGDHVIEALLPVSEEKERDGKIEVFVVDDTVQPVKIKLAERVTGEKGARLRNLPPPKMVAIPIPPGGFMMGDKERANENPVRHVTFGDAFELSATPITFDQWDACLADGGCDGYQPDDRGWGRGTRPVINVS